MEQETRLGDGGGGAALQQRTPLRWLAPLLIVSVHCALVFYFCPPQAVLTERPVFTIDHILHYGQATKVARAHGLSGRMWLYDPFHLAGTVEGVGLDSDNKAVEVFVIVLGKLGVPHGVAFNLFLILVQLCVPFAGYAAARLFGLRHLPACGAAFLFVLLWFFDFFLHWLWYCGMFSYALASCLSAVCLGLFFRFTEASPQDPKTRGVALLGLLVLMPLTHLIHPYTFFILVVPFAVLFVRRVRTLGWFGIGGTVAVALATIGVNLFWLVPTLRFRHYIVVEGGGRYLQTTLSYLLTDYFDVLQDAYESGAFGVRTAFRVAVAVAAVGGLLAWGRTRDARTLPFAAALLWLVGLAYVGSYLGPVSYVQPYRHIAPFTLLLVVPAVPFLGDAFRRERLRALWKASAGAVAILVALAVPRVAITALSWFHPHVTFKTRPAPGENPEAPRPHPLTGLKQPAPPSYRLQEYPQVFELAAATIRRECKGRVLVRDWMLAEALSAEDIPVLGGFYDRVVKHKAANLFASYPDGAMPPEELGPYLERYAVGCLVVSQPTPALESRQDLFELVTQGGGYRLYRTRRDPSYFAKGGGEVRQTLNRLTVEDAQGDDIVLKFHFLETLACTPGCTVEQEPVPGDPVGFIRVRRPPKRFVVYNAFEEAKGGQ